VKPARIWKEKRGKFMFKLHVVQAEFGDCLILEFGTAPSPRYILMDGGPDDIYDRFLRSELQKIAAQVGKLDLVILSHIDTDHVIGLLDFLAALKKEQDEGSPGFIRVDALWHNTFKQTMGPGNDIEVRLKSMLAAAAKASLAMTATDITVKGVAEGNQLLRFANKLHIPINPGFAGGTILVDNAPEPRRFGNLTLQVVGPTQKDFNALKKEWLAWLDQQEGAIVAGDLRLAAKADTSKPNLSSIMLLGAAEGKTVLLTGDGLGAHLLKSLKQAGLLDAQGQLHVNVLKVPHHGSARNVSLDFLKKITADQYIISANGRDGNPDPNTLNWIVEAAREQGRKIEILLTNETDSSRELLKTHPLEKYGYQVTVMPEGASTLTVDLVMDG
jgi:beta-lactamase superfamily II metal-dependent hydrolase